MYKYAYDPLRSSVFNLHNKLAPITSAAGMIGSYASQVQRYAPMVQVGAMIINEEREHAAKQKAKKLQQQQLAQQQAANGQQQYAYQQQQPMQQQPMQQQPMQQPMTPKQAAIRDKIMLINACNYILTVKQAQAYGMPAAMLLREKRASIKKQAFLGAAFGAYGGGKLGYNTGNYLASKWGLDPNGWGAKALKWGLGGLGALGGGIVGGSVDAFTGGIGGWLGFGANLAGHSALTHVGDSMADAADNGATSANAQQTIANMKSQQSSGAGQTSYGQTSFGTA